MFLGNEDTGGVCRTSFYEKTYISAESSKVTYLKGWYPACIWVEEPPKDPVIHNIIHLSASVKEYCKHAFPVFYNSQIFFCFCRPRGIVGHTMLLRNWRYYECGVKINQRRPKRGELRVPATYFDILSTHIRNLTYFPKYEQSIHTAVRIV
jgi:hypothetical protein